MIAGVSAGAIHACSQCSGNFCDLQEPQQQNNPCLEAQMYSAIASRCSASAFWHCWSCNCQRQIVAAATWNSRTGVTITGALCGCIWQVVILLVQVLQPQKRVWRQQLGPAAQGRLQLRLPVRRPLQRLLRLWEAPLAVERPSPDRE